MMLLTKAIKKSIPPLYATDGVPLKEKTVAVKFFTPDAQWTWYAFEGEEQPNGDWRFFGAVDGNFPELGYFHLSQLRAIRGHFGLPVERDRYYDGDKEWKTRDYKKFTG